MYNTNVVHEILKTLAYKTQLQSQINGIFAQKIDNVQSVINSSPDNETIDEINNVFSNGVYYINSYTNSLNQTGSVVYPFNSLNNIQKLITNTKKPLTFYITGIFNESINLTNNSNYEIQIIGVSNCVINSNVKLYGNSVIIFKTMDINSIENVNGNVHIINCNINDLKLSSKSVVNDCKIISISLINNVSGAISNSVIEQNDESKYAIYHNNPLINSLYIVNNIIKGNVVIDNIDHVYHNLFDNNKGISTNGNVQR